jgi:hypothetical protein
LEPALKPLLRPGEWENTLYQKPLGSKRKDRMKQFAAHLSSLASLLDSRTIQLVVLIVTLGLLVLGAGAPAGGGSGIPNVGG